VADEIRPPFYPVKLVLPGITGYTIWGGNFGGERDEFLADGGRVLLYPNRKTMCRRLGIERPHTFDVIDFRGALKALDDGPESATASVGAITGCLDSANDLAIQLDDEAARARLTSENAPLNLLYRFLWGEAAAPLWHEVRDEFRAVCLWFEQHIRT
jgi:hypothetical protein